MKAPNEGRRRLLKTIATAPVLPALAAESQQAEAGANGIVVSREYEEMRVPNLKAAVRSAN